MHPRQKLLIKKASSVVTSDCKEAARSYPANMNTRKFMERLYDYGSIRISAPPRGVNLDLLQEYGYIRYDSRRDSVSITEEGLQFVDSKGWKKSAAAKDRWKVEASDGGHVKEAFGPDVYKVLKKVWDEGYDTGTKNEGPQHAELEMKSFQKAMVTAVNKSASKAKKGSPELVLRSLSQTISSFVYHMGMTHGEND